MIYIKCPKCKYVHKIDEESIEGKSSIQCPQCKIFHEINDAIMTKEQAAIWEDAQALGALDLIVPLLKEMDRKMKQKNSK